MDFWSYLPSYIQAIAVVIATVFAVRGVSAWRRETLGKRRTEIAEQVIVATFRVKAALYSTRNPLSYNTEGKSRKRDEAETERQSSALDEAFIPLERLNDHLEEFSQFDLARLIFRAHFRKENTCHFDEILKIRNEIVMASRMRMRFARDIDRHNEPSDRLIEKYESIVWNHGDDDEINQRIENAVSKIEEVCAKYLTP